MRDMDAFVAKRIMRWSDVHIDAPTGDWVGVPPNDDGEGEAWISYAEIPRYTSKLPSAWDVVGEMTSRGYLFGMTWQRMEGEGPFTWEATFQEGKADFTAGTCNSFKNEAFAICMAALDCLGLLGYMFDGSNPVRTSSITSQTNLAKL